MYQGNSEHHKTDSDSVVCDAVDQQSGSFPEVIMWAHNLWKWSKNGEVRALVVSFSVMVHFTLTAVIYCLLYLFLVTL